MNIVFLRGRIPPKNEHPEKLIYNSIENCEDMWTQLFFLLLKNTGSDGELIYDGGNRVFKYTNFFTERWVPSIKKHILKSTPDLIIARGGFDFYEKFISRYKLSKKIYYGAGKRFYPKEGYFSGYDLFLVDSNKQFKKISNLNKKVGLFIKPASSIFHHVDNCPKKYDICFIANASQKIIKRHDLLLKSFAGSGYKILSIGNTDPDLIRKARRLNVDIEWGGWMSRSNMVEKINQCKVGICCSSGYDSCPRVIPEYLSCGIPVVVTESVNFWKSKYITTETGVVVRDDKILEGSRYCLSKKLLPLDYYSKELSIDRAVSLLSGYIDEIDI